MKEIEAKFYIQDASLFRKRVDSAGARCLRDRTHENNLRFDYPSGELTSQFRVLRLRRDENNVLTYKEPGNTESEVSERVEIEIEVSDFKGAQMLLEALGFQVSFVYEKFRTEFQLEEVEISLDETPLGIFVEIEGPSSAVIQSAAGKLNLSWKDRITDSYADLFNLARFSLGLDVRDMTFANFEGLEVLPAAMGIQPADKSGLV